MSYLLDKKVQRKKFIKIALGVVVLIVLFILRFGVWNTFSNVSEKVFHPVLVLGRGLGEKWGSLDSYFISKNSLVMQNQNLQSRLNEDDAQMSNYNSLLAEYNSLKEILNRKNTNTSMTLAAILAKPNQSVYDTLLIDAGSKQNIKVGDKVFALGDVPIGRVDLVYEDSSKVILFSSSGEITQAVVSSLSLGQAGKNVSMELVGRGGGNFEMVLPKDFTIQMGDQVLLPGINPYVLAIAQKVISDPRDPFTKALLTSPVNIQELNFIEVAQ